MSFFNANVSFFLDAVASTPPIVEVVPLNDVEVFQYLDAHPDALVRYLTERAGLAESLIRTVAPPTDLGEQAAPAKGSILTSVETEVSDDESVMFVSTGVLDEQAVVEDQEDDDDGEVDEYDGLSSDNEASEVESVSQAGPESGSPQAGNETPSPSLPPSPAMPPMTPPASSPVGGDPSLLPFPAPPALVAASRTERDRKRWRLFEEEACIRHMLDINNEGVLKGESRFREAQRRMQVVDNIVKPGNFAVKNFWNRVGRARSGFDERKNKKNPLSTSKQGKAAKASGSQKKTPRKPKAASSTTQNKRKVKDESDSDGDDESYFSIESEDESTPQRTSKKRNRGDDTEDEWEPDLQTVNAVAKGLRTPKRARTAV